MFLLRIETLLARDRTMDNRTSYHREGIHVKFWGRLFGRIAIVLLMVGSAFAYEAPQFMLVAFAVAGSAIALSMQRYRDHLLGRPEEDSAGIRAMERRLAAVERRQEQDVMELEEQYHDRMADVEERLDFTERLLGNQTQREPERYQTPV